MKESDSIQAAKIFRTGYAGDQIEEETIRKNANDKLRGKVHDHVNRTEGKAACLWQGSGDTEPHIDVPADWRVPAAVRRAQV